MKRFFRKGKSSSSSPQPVVNAWESTEETTPQAVVVSEKTEITGPSREQTPVMMNGDKQDNSDNENPQSSVPEVGPASTSIEMPPATPEKKKHKPSKARLAFRFWQVLAAVGATPVSWSFLIRPCHMLFLTGASTVFGTPDPFFKGGPSVLRLRDLLAVFSLVSVYDSRLSDAKIRSRRKGKAPCVLFDGRISGGSVWRRFVL